MGYLCVSAPAFYPLQRLLELRSAPRGPRPAPLTHTHTHRPVLCAATKRLVRICQPDVTRLSRGGEERGRSDINQSVAGSQTPSDSVY